MDWSKVTSAIGTIAPWIAGTLGTPVAGLAVQALCGAFGLSSEQATPDNILAAVKGATPDQLLGLKQADFQHQQTMQKLGYDHIEKLEEMAVSDRDSARKREMAIKDDTPKKLAYLLIGGFLGVSLLQLVALMFFPNEAKAIPSQGWLLIGNISGYLAAEAKQAGAYYFGTTQGSDKKTDLLAQAPAIEKGKS